MTEQHLTGLPEFAEAIKHFNVSTAVTYAPDLNADGREVKKVYPMDVFTPETIDANPQGVRETYDSRLAAMSRLEEVIGNGEEL
ncbi:hypothetical protein AAA63_004295 [Salmonella enterica subsp. enterica]|nr:hypothetical protein [Salmonella enterica subsp. enterica serovar Poona]